MMIKKIFGTATARFLNAALSLVILGIIAKQLGAEAVGTISLIVLAVAIIQNINSLAGGAPIVYYITRIPTANLILISYTWCIISSLGGTLIMYHLKLFPPEYVYEVLALSLILSLGQIHQMWLLGKERIKLFNIISVLQILATLGTLAYYIFIAEEKDVAVYIRALFVGYSIVLLFAASKTLGKISGWNPKILRQDSIQIFRYGFMVQLAAIFQLLNNRLAYYIVKQYLGLKSLGHFDVGVKLSEGMWLVGKSVSLVQYARISGNKEPEYAKNLTISLLKFTVFITFLMICFLLLIPEMFFVAVFGAEFHHVQQIIFYLSPGILSIAASMIFSHYFSGTGRPFINTIASAIGLTGIAIGGFVIIPEFGLAGAALATSAAYFCSLVFQWIMFFRLASPHIMDFVPSKKDIKTLQSIYHQLINKN